MDVLPGPRKPKPSLKRYASEVFKESSVSAVSAIVSTGSVPRKVFRVLVFVVFTAGFLYQCVKFLSYVLEYPTVVNVEIVKPITYLAPSYTYCNYNPIKRSKFCATYPKYCVDADYNFCENNKKICGRHGTKIPIEGALEDLEITAETMLQLGHERSVIFTDNQDRQFQDPDQSGPLPRRRKDLDNVSSCFAIYTRVDNALDPLLHTRERYFNTPRHVFRFDVEESELFNPNFKPGIVFAIHSQFDAANPFLKGIFMRPGYSYHIQITMQQDRLLPHPYKTDCMNYTAAWLKNNKTGPRSQEMCRQKCYLDVAMYCYNCTFDVCLYPSTARICYYDEYEDSSVCNGGETDIGMQLLRECIDHCKDDCVVTRYSYVVQELFMASPWKNESFQETSTEIKVDISFDDSEIVTIQYRPQFQEVEAFSYIGGFIGIWLGVSLVQVADVFESLFRIGRYLCCRKRKAGGTCCRRKRLRITPRSISEESV